MTARAMPPMMADMVGAWLGRTAHGLLISRRKVALENMRSALGEEMSEVLMRRNVLKVFESVGRTAIEVARFGKTRPDDIRRFVTGYGAEQLARAHEMGKGCIVLTAHFGNWEYVGSWVAAMGYPMDILVYTQHNPVFDRLLNDLRKRMGVNVIKIGTNVRQVFRALNERHVIGIAADQHDPAGNLVIRFFGREAAASRGPAVFSLRTGAPILPVLLRREKFDRHVVMAGDLILPSEKGNEDEKVRCMIEQFHRFLEDSIRSYPDQWLWTHRRWKADTGEAQVQN